MERETRSETTYGVREGVGDGVVLPEELFESLIMPEFEPVPPVDDEVPLFIDEDVPLFIDDEVPLFIDEEVPEVELIPLEPAEDPEGDVEEAPLVPLDIPEDPLVPVPDDEDELPDPDVPDLESSLHPDNPKRGSVASKRTRVGFESFIEAKFIRVEE